LNRAEARRGVTGVNRNGFDARAGRHVPFPLLMAATDSGPLRPACGVVSDVSAIWTPTAVRVK